jgi:hypothetical protein
MYYKPPTPDSCGPWVAPKYRSTRSACRSPISARASPPPARVATSAEAPASGEVLIVHMLLNTDLTSRLINGDWACREVCAEQCRRYGLHGLALRAAAARRARMLRSPKLQCKSGRPGLGSSRPRLRPPASAGHPRNLQLDETIVAGQDSVAIAFASAMKNDTNMRQNSDDTV